MSTSRNAAQRTVTVTSGKTRNTATQPRKQWELRLYVCGLTARALTAFENLEKICEEHLAGEYSIEVIDLTKTPQLARGDQIVAVPTLVRRLPEPVRKIIGDLSDTEKVLIGLDLRPRQKGTGRRR